MRRYNPAEIEPKWQQEWDKSKVYEADLQSDKPKYYAMSMFNYPSGAGIHIGHAMNYTISDVMARYKRQAGYESYHPVGWDAFGLPAENFAIKSGISPQASMAKIIPSYHTQYKAMGWSNDWSKEIATHEPIYYKWTQWIFSEMFRAGLVYQDARMQWWCDQCQTVLANEQVINDKCWRHDGVDDPEVAKREVKQWFFKITDYADELLEATDQLDWTDSVKLAQKNWIGKSVGAEIDFEIDGHDEKVTVFTTRPDTLYGATFLVLAPEHDLVESIASDEMSEQIHLYIKEATKKTELERQEAKDKTGVFTGQYAINPLNGNRLPIWIADYVLTGYGTGAIMAVPAHDERDNVFANRYNLPIVEVIKNPANNNGEIYTGDGVLTNSAAYNGEDSAAVRDLIIQHFARENTGRPKTNYKIRDWSVSRQRYWGAPIPIVNCVNCGPVLVPDSDLPVVLPELKDFAPSGDGRSALARAEEWLNTSCPECGGKGQRETDTLDTYICSSWYFLRYLDPANEEQIFGSEIANKWMPVDFYNGGDHATAHMIYARFVTRFLYKKGLLDNPEPFKKFLFNGKVKASDGSAFSKSKGNGVDPLEIIKQGYGADALRTYLMFAAPLDFDSRWDPQGVPGTHRFLSRLWNIAQEFLETETTDGEEIEVLRAIHPAIKKVTEDLEDQKYNTAIATLMKLLNQLYEIKTQSGFKGGKSWQFALESLAALVAPFAPHIADELWHQLGHDSSVQRDSWPEWQDEYLLSDVITMAVQINGKLRSEIEVAVDASNEQIQSQALNNQKIKDHIGDKSPARVIVVPKRLVNIVIK